MIKKLQLKKKSVLVSTLILLFIVLGASGVTKSYAANNKTIYNTENQAQQIKDKKITIRMSNSSLKEILYAINKQSNISFIYGKDKELDTFKASLDVTNVSVEQALNKLLANSGFSYKIVDNGISIFKEVKESPKSSEKLSIQGKVIEKGTKTPITGALVIVKGTTKGTITDDKGSFRIPSVLEGSDLEISFVGMKPLSLKVSSSNANNMILTMEPDAMQVDDVVVNGIFARKSGTFTGSVTTIKKEDLKRVGNSNVLQALRNIDPSVVFYDNMEFGSDPNKLPEMSLRGKTSLDFGGSDLRSMYQTDPNAPLFVLDGFEVSLQKVMDLDMERVETMTILKDASAKSIYGSKAANGVIVIELKKNSDGRLRVSYNGSVEIQAPDLTSYNLTNAAEKLDVEKAHGLFEDPNGYYGSTQLMLNKMYNQKRSFVASGIDTDWLSKPLQMGVGTKHGISVELGEGALKSIIDLSYNNVEGVMIGSDRTNISGGITLNYRHKKFLFRNQLTITSNKSNDSKYGSFREYASINPYYTPYDQSGNLLKNIVPELTDPSNSVDVGLWYKELEYEENPLYNASLNTILQDRYIDVTNNFDLQYFVTKELKLTAKFGLTEQRQKKDEFYPSDHLKFRSLKGDDELRKGSYDLTHGQQSNLTGKFDVQYNKEFSPKHNIYANMGFDIGQKISLNNLFNAEGFPSDMMQDIIFARQYVKESKPSGNEQTVRELGYYINATYSYDERFNVDASLRQNASSLYGANNRWGTSWSTGFAWNIHKEKWINQDLFSNLRLRGSIGSSGSQSSSAYNSIATYGYFLDRTYEGLIGAQLKGMKNADLKWQQKNEQNIGLELRVKKNLSLSFDYYFSVTNNTLNPLSLPPSTGFLTVQENAGKVVNNGYNARASWTVWSRPKDRAYLTINAAISGNTNKLKEISDALKSYNEHQNTLANNGKDENGVAIVKPLSKFYDGVSMGAIWALQSLGIDPANGRELYVRRDAYGNPFRSYVYDANSQIVCGDQFAKMQGNFGFNFEYKGFGLNATMSFKYGGQMYNNTLVSKVENANLAKNVDRRIFTDRWRKPGDISPYKSIQKTTYTDTKKLNASSQTLSTSRFVQDDNELKISSLQLTYDFYNFKFVKSMKLERLRVAFNVNDLATISSVTIERGTSYPFARTFNGSISFTF